MARKKKEAVAELPGVPATVPEVKTFEYGDLAVICKCGRTQIIHKGVEKGLQLVLVTREDSFIQLKCDECGADMKLQLLEGEKPVEVETEIKETPLESEDIQEESKQEQSL